MRQLIFLTVFSISTLIIAYFTRYNDNYEFFLTWSLLAGVFAIINAFTLHFLVNNPKVPPKPTDK